MMLQLRYSMHPFSCFIACLFTHTGHMVYLLDRSDKNTPNSLFTGDILFLGGNGEYYSGLGKHAIFKIPQEYQFLWLRPQKVKVMLGRLSSFSGLSGFIF